jgi:hypothetical protein
MKRFQDDTLATWMAWSENLSRINIDEPNKHDDVGLLSCDLAQFCLALWALSMRIAESIHHYFCIGTSAVAVDVVCALVAQEHERHEVTSDQKTVWLLRQ